MKTSKTTLLVLGCILALLRCTPTIAADTKSIAERLGYPADAKLVILHADDLAVSHSVDQASFAALDQGAVSSAQRDGALPMAHRGCNLRQGPSGR